MAKGGKEPVALPQASSYNKGKHKEAPMIQEERKTLILRALEEAPVVKLEELAARLGVSVDTIRRDLKALDREGRLQYIRGGAKAIRPAEQFYPFKGREIINIEQKKSASRKALEWVKKGDVIFLNSGTTNTILAGELARAAIPCTVVTNNLPAACAAAASPCCTVHLVGGRLDGPEQSTCGTACLAEIAAVYPDLCFLSVNAMDTEAGLTDFRLEEIPIMQTLLRTARQTAAVMDSTKLDRVAKRQVFSSREAPPIITDDALRPEDRARYIAAGLRLL